MTATKPTEFKPDYRIALLSALGLFGFLLGGLLLFYPDIRSFRKADSVFHEMVYMPKNLVVAQLDSAVRKLDTLNKDIREKKKKLAAEAKAKDKTVKDSLERVVAKDSILRAITWIDEQIERSQADRKILMGYINDAYISAADTSGFKKWNTALNFTIIPDSLASWEDQYQKGRKEFKAPYIFRDPDMSFSLVGIATLNIKQSSSDTSFMARYPTSGIWILLLLVFCSFLCIAISTSIYLNNKILELFDKNVTGLKSWHYYFYVALTFVALFAIWFIGKKSFNDEEVIRDMFFMGNFKYSMLYIQVLGFLGGAFCLAGFIYTASMLGYFTGELKKRETRIAEQKQKLETQKNAAAPAPALPAGDAAAPPAPAADDAEKKAKETLLKTDEDAQERDKKIYEQLRKYFQTYFILAAIILSLLVLCTGGLYGIVNDMPFVKLLADDWGYSPARTDFIYLYGGTYTVILLLVYLPAKMRFNEISFTDDTKKEDGKEGSKWYSFLKDPFSQMKGLLVATSPLLASLVQSLFDALFG